jgi:hypothetical protein
VVDKDKHERFSLADRYRRQLIETLSSRLGLTSVEPAHLVGLLFGYLRYAYSEEEARHWFVEQGRSKEPHEQSEIANWALLQRYDLEIERLGDAFKVMQFVHAEVEANKKLPKSKQRGAGGINSSAFYVQLRKLLTERGIERKQAAELARQRQLRLLRESVDYGRRRLAEVSAAFARASIKIGKTSGPTPT